MTAAAAAADPKVEIALSSIQPLRDLAKNWDVDIASCLEDYLHEIVSVVHEEQAQPNPETTNFAQAALLLQNSSGVYSRKVEYLYTLVYAALDSLTSQNATNNKQISSRKTDAEIDEFEHFDEHLEFLLLDDVLPIDDGKIDLPSKGLQHLDTSAFLPSSTAHLSLGMSTTIDRTETAAQNVVLTSLTNACCILQQAEGNSQGMFYMRGTTESIQDTRNRLSSFGTAIDMAVEEPAHDNTGDGDIFNHDDDDNEGPGFEFADSTEPSLPALTQAAPQQLQHKKQNGAWDLLDPHDAEQIKGRPLRIGTTYKLPDGLLGPPSEFVTGARTKKQVVKQKRKVDLVAAESQPICIATATFKATMANDQRRRERRSLGGSGIDQDMPVEKIERPIVPLQGLAFGDEFAYIAKAAAKRKAIERREKRKLLIKEPHSIPPREADHLLGYDDDEYYGGGGDDDSYGEQDGGNGGLGAFDQAFARSDNELSNSDGVTFEELCRTHIRAFAKGAEKYRAETNLTKRVGDWQLKLFPILEEEEARPEFDIHVYGEHVIESIKNNDKSDFLGGSKQSKTHFSSMTKTKQQYDVCRLFLASLSLVNSGNIEILSNEGEVMGPDTLIFELVNSNVNRPMETYLAPSVMDCE